MAENGESLDNINELLNLEETGDGEEDNSKDLETFGDIGPLTNEWEDKHQQLAGDIERERHAQVLLGDSNTEHEGKFDATRYAFFGGGENLAELGGDGLEDAITLAQLESRSTDKSDQLEMKELDKITNAFGKLNTTSGTVGGQLDEPSQMPSGVSVTLPEEAKWYSLPSDLSKDDGNAKEVANWQILPEQQYIQHRGPELKLPRAQAWWEEEAAQKQVSYQQLPVQLPLSHAGHPGYPSRSSALPAPGLTSQQFQYMPGQAPPTAAGQWSMPHSGAPAPDSHALSGLQGMDMAMLQQHHQRLRPHVAGQFRQPHQLPQRPMGPPQDRHPGHQGPHGFPAEINAGQRQAPYQNYNVQGRRQPGPMRSKYMTQEEIENIMRIQWSATHTSDPYIDDYYHQAMQQKLAAGTPHGRRHFAPAQLRDLPSHAKIPAEQPSFLALNGLGRLPFANVRRPRPLLDVEPHGPPDAHNGQMKAPLRPLEQEPMLYARMVVDEGLCISLDIDDIDRTLASTNLPDGGQQLRRQRQVLLELLAQTLQLTDDSSQMLDGRGGRMRGAKDELLFLRLCSLSKGKKLLTRYLQLVNPSSDLARMAAVAVMRHLRFLFGGAQADPNGSTNMLAAVVANAGANMDLPALSACLAAVVVATDQPPLRPMGAPAGDGATIILKTLLDRATQILQERGGSTVPVHHQAMWQASFDAFFLLLSKYCANKYESIVNSMAMSANGDMNAIAAAAATAMGKEMPVEILFASLPHTNDHQRKLLLDFTQRSMGPFPAMMGNEAYSNAAPVRC